jgi:hypothetical protein
MSRAFRCIVASLTIVALLCAAAPARAESVTERIEGPWPAGKKFVVYSFVGLYVVSTTLLVYSLARADSAHGRINEDFPRKAGDPGLVDCTTAAQCADLRSAVDERRAWSDRTPYFAVAMVGTLFAAGATAALWPNGNTRVAPAASEHGGTLTLVGHF